MGVHPKSETPLVLALHNGHAACRRMVSIADCQFITADGSKTKIERFDNLLFCAHIKNMHRCIICNGCPHGKLRDSCRTCRLLSSAEDLARRPHHWRPKNHWMTVDRPIVYKAALIPCVA